MVPPVPVIELAEKLGAKIKKEAFVGKGDVSGMLFRDGSHAIIGVNANHARTRQRFTIAHEIGHLLLHEGKEVHLDRNFAIRVILRDSTSSDASRKEEIEANRFAAELLMPFDMLIEDIEKNPIDVEDQSAIKHLAKKYAVSSQAMTFRVLNLVNDI